MLAQSLMALVTAVSGILGALGTPQAAAPDRPAAVAAAVTAAAEPQACPSYWVAADDGGVFTAGAAPFRGSGAGKLGAPVVGVAGTPSGRGYWLAAANGRVAAFGDAQSLGDARGTRGVVALAARPTGDGYWLATADGRVLGFGGAAALGSLAGRPLRRPVVAMASSPSGKGYLLATADGGVFTFGDARFAGAAPSARRSIVAMAGTPSGEGYWLASADGGVFSFGDARFYGAAAGVLPRPVTAMAASPTARGYWLASADGRVIAFGDARAAAPVRYPTDASRVVGIARPASSLPCPAATPGRKVVFLGDSVMFDVAAALEPALKQVPGTVVASRPWFAYGLDLSRQTYDWRKEWPTILGEEDPDVVVVLAGFGDLWAKTTAPADQRPETAEWRARYAKVVGDATRVLTAGGAKVVWIGLPWVADTNIYFPNVRARVASANQVFREAVARTPGASFVDAASLLGGPNGGYAFTVLDGTNVVQLRKPDGLHLCPPGVVRVAQAAGAEVVRTFGETLRPGWEQGPWRADVRFHQGPTLDCK
ncbi:MAG: Esterase [Acidimicrobiales bacterium]|nr:Esterase [Acidimicrobiales bacterium]